MKNFALFLLLISGALFSQEIIKDSLKPKGRFTEFKFSSNRLTVDTPYFIPSFTEKHGILTTEGRPHFGVKFLPYEMNSDVVIQDLFTHEDFKKEFPNAEIYHGATKKITSHKTYVDSTNQKVTQLTRIYAVKGGLLYFFFTIPVENKSHDTVEKEVTDFLAYVKLEENFYTNTNLHK